MQSLSLGHCVEKNLIILEKYEVFLALCLISRLEAEGISLYHTSEFPVDLLHIVWLMHGPPLELCFKFSNITSVRLTHMKARRNHILEYYVEP